MQNSGRCYWQKIKVEQCPLSLEMWQSGSAVGNSFFNEQEEKEGDMTHAAKQFAIDTTLSGQYMTL